MKIYSEIKKSLEEEKRSPKIENNVEVNKLLKIYQKLRNEKNVYRIR